MKQGTVICVGNFELPDKNAAAHRVLNNAKLFRTLGFNTVFLGTNREDKPYDGLMRCDYRVGFDIYEQSYPKTSKAWARQILNTENVRRLAEQYPDTTAILLYNTQYATVLAVKNAFRRRGVRVLYDCTEWNAYTEGGALKRRVKTLDSTLIEKRLAPLCDGIIAVSDRIAAAYQGPPVLTLPPLVDTEDPIWRQPRLKRDRFEFLYAGAPSDKERLDVLLAAFARLPADQAQLRLIGLDRDGLAAVSADAAMVADRENVLFEGRRSHEESVQAILSCDCFVFLREPTRRNDAGFPTKFAEAFTCGVPVIAAAVGDLPVYADEACRLLPRVEMQTVKEAMSFALADGPRRVGLRKTFDYRSRTEACRSWLEKIL